MEKVYLLSYKSIHAGINGIVNRIIRSMDKTIYSHSELSIGNPFEGEVCCYSASGVDHGVRMKLMTIDPEHWDVQEIPWITADQVREFFNKTDESPYDYLGVGRFAFPWMLREHPVRYFCSEWAAEALGFPEAWRYGPAILHGACKNAGGIEVKA